MILQAKDVEQLHEKLDELGVGEEIKIHKAVLIKINLARPAEVGHPRTDFNLLCEVIKYTTEHKGKCAIAEAANGYLRTNLERMGLGQIIEDYDVEVLDLDLQDTDKVIIEGEEHFIPKCFKDYKVRIAIPAASKREGMIFSNNIKLFVGAVPRSKYQTGSIQVDWRPRIHENLHKSVANIYKAIQQYSPFTFYINGGTAMDEAAGEFQFKNIILGKDALELDFYVLNNMFSKHEIPEYLKILEKSYKSN